MNRLFHRVSDDTAIRIGRIIGGVSMASSVIAVIMILAIGEIRFWYREFGAHNAVGGFLFGLLLFIAVARQPRNAAVWVLGVSGLLQSVFQTLSGALIIGFVVDQHGSAALIDPLRSLDPPSWVALLVWFVGWSWLPAIGLMIGWAFLLFPDGTLPGPRWRPVAWVGAVSMSLATLGLMTMSPDAVESADLPALTKVSMPFVALFAVVSLVSVVVRYRRATGDLRHQLRWMSYAAVVFGGLFISGTMFDWLGPTVGLTQALSLATLPLLVAAYGVAVMKYRLYDIDLVISKSVAYLGLAAVIAGLYAAVVIMPLLVIGQPDDGGPGLVLPIVAAAVVALVFEPIRSRTQRWANRLVYGNRASPYEVLSQVTSDLPNSADGDSTSDLARLLVRGTGAERAVVWLATGETLTANGVFPDADGSTHEFTV